MESTNPYKLLKVTDLSMDGEDLEGTLERYPYLAKKKAPYRAKADIRWPRAVWISGEGRWASVAHCNDLTVQLHPTREEAEAAKRIIDGSGCGGFCYRDHTVIDMDTWSRKEEEYLHKWHGRQAQRESKLGEGGIRRSNGRYRPVV